MSAQLSRRDLLQVSVALFAKPNLHGVVPSAATVVTEDGIFPLARTGNSWQAPHIELVTEVSSESSISLRLKCDDNAATHLHLRWSMPISSQLRFLGDAWERSYGDLSFRPMEPDRIMPWYVLAVDRRLTRAFGVQTGASALCFWQIDPDGISLWCDLRNGGRGVELGSRELFIGVIVWRSYSDRTPFQAAHDFCRILCSKPLLPKAPLYGGNNWYYAYGHSSASDIIQDSERIASVATSTTNRPWMVIDDGWSTNRTAGPWRQGNAQFADMPRLTSEMQKAGVKPGIWMRPLYTRTAVPESWLLRPLTLDPTVPEVAALIEADIKTLSGWGYRLIKHDFSTFDFFGRWGFQMNQDITDSKWNFHDRTRTSAEIIRDFYKLLRKAAGDTLLLGCNTIGHLCAGLFEAQRTGDDTSGRDWKRTRKMGVNTLAFRLPQHNTFFAIDADCVGITKEIDWRLNRQWLDLLARSGSPLFVSIAPDAFGPEQKQALREAFDLASRKQPLAEPLDWLTNSEPQHWLADGGRRDYDWFDGMDTSPFVG